MLGTKFAAGTMRWLCATAERHYGIPQSELLAAAGLDSADVNDPAVLLPAEAAYDICRFVLERTGDRGFGLRLARSYDVRGQGHWGYAVLSALTLREKIELQIRYLPLRAPFRHALRVEGDRAVLECVEHRVPPDLLPLAMDCGVAGSVLTNRSPITNGPVSIEAWVSYPEEPHHRELRQIVGDKITFGASCNQIAFPASELDLACPGDRHLGELMREHLEKRLAELKAEEGEGSLLEEVRHRLGVRLAQDATLEDVARDLRVSARTLRRRLQQLGASFKELLEEVRQERAIRYLSETDDSIDQLASRLGYGHASNFRRAFRRWTGAAPMEFRATRRPGFRGTSLDSQSR